MEKYKKVIYQRGMINVNYLMYNILYEICNIILGVSLKDIEKRLIIIQQKYMETKEIRRSQLE